MKWHIQIEKFIRVGEENNVLVTEPFLNYRETHVYSGDMSCKYDPESCDSIFGNLYCEPFNLDDSKKMRRKDKIETAFSDEITSIVERETSSDNKNYYFIRLIGVNREGACYFKDHVYCPWALKAGRFSPPLLYERALHGFRKEEIQMIAKLLELK